MRINVLIFICAIILFCGGCSSHKCNCRNQVKNFNYIEPRYKRYLFSTGRYEESKKYSSFDSIPLKRINKHIYLILKCTNIKIYLPTNTLDFPLYKDQVEAYRSWIKNNCGEEYKKYYTPPNDDYIYTPWKTINKKRKNGNTSLPIKVKTLVR
ncbi:MAG: hypothetical protein NTZ33_15410 [Bacteroidetes bacterium]|nr:hypothetical protein [Bacteroidota bacterium]